MGCIQVHYVLFTSKETMSHGMSTQTGSTRRETQAVQLDTRQDVICMVIFMSQQE